MQKLDLKTLQNVSGGRALVNLGVSVAAPHKPLVSVSAKVS
jgi:hypothetical protein